MMNDALASMIPYDSIGLYEQPKPRFFFKMPRVVPEQKSKFESDELFRRLSRECEVRMHFKCPKCNPYIIMLGDEPKVLDSISTNLAD